MAEASRTKTAVAAGAHTIWSRSLSYFIDEVCQFNFYRVHLSVFLVVIAVASVILYGEGLAQDPRQVSGDKLQYVDALFLSCSAITTTGLNTINMSDLTAFQQAVLLLLMLVGNIPFTSTFVVFVRRHWFRKKLAHLVESSKSARDIVEDMERARSHEPCHGRDGLAEDASSIDRQLRYRKPDARAADKAFIAPRGATSRTRPPHQTGQGGFPAPWEVEGVKQLLHRYRWDQPDLNQQQHPYLSFQPSFDHRGRFRALTEVERDELGGIEYRALNTLVWILIFYTFFWYALGTALLVPYSYHPAVTETVRTSQPGDLSPGWWGFFSVITSFTNCGLNLLNANFTAFQSYYFILMVAGGLTWAGNTQFPVFLRFVIWSLSKVFPKGTRRHESLAFLLHHPRRCFIYLFPARETWILLAVQIGIDLTLWVFFEILNIGLPAVESLDRGVRMFDGLFQATGARKSGAYIITLSSLAPALLILYMVAMYTQNFPIVLTLRRTNLYEERSIGLDTTDVGGTIGKHLRNQLAYDLWFMLLVWWLICIIERGQLDQGAAGFGVFQLMFETVSAYGNVGLSTGVPYDSYSLSGQFHILSKLVLMVAMLRGRHRGMPLAVDRSILLPGQELMAQLDEEYNEKGRRDRGKEQESRQAEAGGEEGYE